MKIRVEIGKNGEVKVSVEQVKGSQCMKLTKELEEKLGSVVERKKTAEYYENAVEQKNYVKQRW